MQQSKSQTRPGGTKSEAARCGWARQRGRVPEACRSGGRLGLSLGVLAHEVRAFPALSSLSETPRIHSTLATNAIYRPDWLSRE